MGFDDPNNAAAAQVGLKDFDALVDNAAKEQATSTYVMNVMQRHKLVGR